MDGVKDNVELLITGNGKETYRHNIGFKKAADGTYTATGDFWGLKNKDGKALNSEYLTQEVTASAKEAEINERLMKLGFENVKTEETSNYIEITMQRW